MKKMFKAFLAGTVAITPVVAFAAIDNTHHDMTYATPSKEKCAYCHSKILGANDATYGKVGAFCVLVCHMAGTGPAGAGRPQVNPDNADYYSFDEVGNAISYTNIPGLAPDALKNGHQFSTTLLVDVAGEANQTTMLGTNWPHLEADVDMECTSCHAVHDNTNPPFLNAPYAGLPGPVTAFCERCHTTKSGTYGNPGATGNHPTAMAFNQLTALNYDGTNASQKTDVATKMGGRTLRWPGSATAPAPGNLYAGFTAVAPGATPQLTANAIGTSWNLAGHVLETAAAGTLGLPVQAVGIGSANNRFGCYSCHNAHQDNASTGLIDPVEAKTQSTNVLLLAADGPAPANMLDVSDACYGCHGDTANPNDAGKSNFGHPINNETVVSDVNGWTVPINAATALNFPADTADADGTPKCLQCHDVHNGVTTGLMSLRFAAPAGGSACTACHDASFTANVADSHHPGQVAVDYNAAANGSFVDPAWKTVDQNGDLTDGLSCPDCHVGDGNNLKRSTAHNWLP